MPGIKIPREIGNPDFVCAVRTELATMCFNSYVVRSQNAGTAAIADEESKYLKLKPFEMDSPKPSLSVQDPRHTHLQERRFVSSEEVKVVSHQDCRKPYGRLRKMASSCASSSYTNAWRCVSSPKGTTLKVDELQCCELFKEDFGKRNMPGKRARRHFSQLSEFERGLIIGMKTAGWSTRRVAGQVDRSECPVRNCWEQWTREGTHVRKNGSGAARKTARRKDRRIVRQALVDPTVTRSTTRADVGAATVPQTISRHLAEANLKSKRPFRALP
ncbi:transposable element Tc1 transposase [Trichonephila clavipes]|nr:transposable element Tc1 transposase [Trichonephila clavipes]